jgi:hypothetical protein
MVGPTNVPSIFYHSLPQKHFPALYRYKCQRVVSIHLIIAYPSTLSRILFIVHSSKTIGLNQKVSSKDPLVTKKILSIV